MDLFWTGTDALLFKHYPKGISFKYRIKIFIMRIMIRIFDKLFIQRHLIVDEYLRQFLDVNKPIFQNDQTFQELKVYDKIKHDTFNILYYHPKFKSNRVYHNEIYGYDVYCLLREWFGDRITWLVVDGSADMDKIYPYVDFYLRPNRHDGMPHMINTCRLNNIPYYWSRKNPDVNQIVKMIKDIL